MSLTAIPTLCGVLRERLPAGTVVVSPDAGRVQSLCVTSVAPLIAGAIRRFMADGSLSDLY